MKIYRYIVGVLMVFFIIVVVWYVASCYNEQRSIEDGILIWNVEESNEHTGSEIYLGSDIKCHR